MYISYFISGIESIDFRFDSNVSWPTWEHTAAYYVLTTVRPELHHSHLTHTLSVSRRLPCRAHLGALVCAVVLKCAQSVPLRTSAQPQTEERVRVHCSHASRHMVSEAKGERERDG